MQEIKIQIQGKYKKIYEPQAEYHYADPKPQLSFK